MRRSLAISRFEFRILLTDPGTLVFIIFMPLLMMAFLKPVFRLALVSEGFTGANGSEHAVPGMAVMFGAFFTGFVGFSFLREHGWGTWERLRASPSRPIEIMVGKVIPSLAVSLLQLLGLFALGGPLFGLQVQGSLVALGVLSLALSVCLLAFGVAMTALSRTAQQLNAISSLGGMLFATLGGALVPLGVLPSWVRAMAPIMPTYWAMDGFRSVILEGTGLESVVIPCLALVSFTAVFGLVAAMKFRFEESKTYYG